MIDIHLTTERFCALIEALDQFVSNEEQYEESNSEYIPSQHKPAAQEMLTELNKVRSDIHTVGLLCPACEMRRPVGQATGAHMVKRNGVETCCFGDVTK
jgi:hypothetical protein